MLNQSSLSNSQCWQYIEGLENKIYTAVKRNLEDILEVKTFLKMFIGFKCRVPKVELRFCSFLGYVHFSTTGTDNVRKKNEKFLCEQKIV